MKAVLSRIAERHLPDALTLCDDHSAVLLGRSPEKEKDSMSAGVSCCPSLLSFASAQTSP